MSKILEALEHARADTQAGGSRNEGVGPGDQFKHDETPAAAGQSGVSLGEEMVALYQRLDALLPSGTTRALEFIGSREGEGTSTVVGEFARVSATRFDQRVLLLAADASARVGRLIDPGPGAGAPDAPGRAVRRGTLDVAPLPQEFLVAPHAADTQGPAAIWARLRSEYDLIVVDAPAATTSPLGLAVSRQVDGVVLVFAADGTRWPVASRVKQSIEQSGGCVLGIVFNKRQYHIPDWIYKRL